MVTVEEMVPEIFAAFAAVAAGRSAAAKREMRIIKLCILSSF
jgi:hypothetical protein